MLYTYSTVRLAKLGVTTGYATETKNWSSVKYLHYVDGFLVDGDYHLIKKNKLTGEVVEDWVWHEITPPFKLPQDGGIAVLVNTDNLYYNWISKPKKYHPCWFIREGADLTIVDMLTNKVIGYGTPIPGKELKLGKYTLIYITAPDRASEGEIVDVSIRVYNSDYENHVIWTQCAAPYKGNYVIDETDIINARADKTYRGSFRMPGNDCTVRAYTYYPSGKQWISDAYKEKIISLSVSEYNLRTSVSPANSGYVVPSSGSYPKGEKIEIHAVSNPGYRFERWGGAISSTAWRTTITMDSDKSVVAYFEEVTTKYTLTIDISGRGYTSPSKGSHTYDEGTQVTISSYPLSGHILDHWEKNGDIWWGSPSYTISMFSDSHITAHFAPKVCNEGDTKCVGYSLYKCVNNQWELVEYNSPQCGYVPPCLEGQTKCDGYTLYQCINGQWQLVQENSPECGYIPPTPDRAVAISGQGDPQNPNSDWWKTLREFALQFYRNQGWLAVGLPLPSKADVIRELKSCYYWKNICHGSHQSMDLTYEELGGYNYPIPLTYGDVVVALLDRDPYKLAFIDSCAALDSTELNSWAQAFTKNKRDHFVVGLHHVIEHVEAWDYLYVWEPLFYLYLESGSTVKDAFDASVADCPEIACIVGMYEGTGMPYRPTLPLMLYMRPEGEGCKVEIIVNDKTYLTASVHTSSNLSPNDRITLKAHSTPNHEFVWWFSTEFPEGIDKYNPIISFVLNSPMSISAVFREPDAPPAENVVLQVSILPEGTGEVDPPGGIYISGTGLKLTSIPYRGYALDHWSGDVAGTSSSVSITMDKSKSVTAHFRESKDPLDNLIRLVESTRPQFPIKAVDDVIRKAAQVVIDITPPVIR